MRRLLRQSFAVIALKGLPTQKQLKGVREGSCSQFRNVRFDDSAFAGGFTPGNTIRPSGWGKSTNSPAPRRTTVFVAKRRAQFQGVCHGLFDRIVVRWSRPVSHRLVVQGQSLHDTESRFHCRQSSEEVTAHFGPTLPLLGQTTEPRLRDFVGVLNGGCRK
jgi:phosphoribosylformylglycinamidine (FGAM) synthase-like amidotransferase family enzyme